MRNSINPKEKLKHWRGFQAENCLNPAPVLEFCVWAQS